MPNASELEEFGLEVEHEHEAFLGAPSGGGAAGRSPRRISPLGISASPSKSSSGNNRSSSRINYFRPGMLKWAILVIVLALAVFFNLGQESEETNQEMTPEDYEVKKFKVFGGGGKSDVATLPSSNGESRENENEPVVVNNDNNNNGGGNNDSAEVEDDGNSDEGESNKGNDDSEPNDDDGDEGIDAGDIETQTNPSEDDDNSNEGEISDESVSGSNEGNDDSEPDDDDGNEGIDGSDVDIRTNPSEAVEENGKVDTETTLDTADDADKDNIGTTSEQSEQPAPTAGEMEKGASDGANNTNFGSFSLERLQETRNAAMGLISGLENYYSKYGNDKAKQMFLNGWLEHWDFDGSSGDSSTKRERADKLIDTLARALVTDDQTEFLIGTIGSSVAAGHDNCHYDSYESQMERTFGPVWEAAGMKLVCQNSGEGGGCGDDYRNQVFCLKQNVSPNIDIAHYTWTYFEAGSTPWVERESLIRWAQMLPRQPPVHVFNTGELPDYVQSDEYKLTEHYSKYGYNAFYMQSGLYLGGHDYGTEKRDGVDRFAWGNIGDGYHDVVRYGENEVDDLRKESLGVVMRNWHPGPLAFQFTADTFSYVYTRAMLKALDLIEKDLREGKDPRQMWSASKRKILMKKSLPEPKYCDPEYCVVDEAPGCLNYEKPTFGQWGARVEDPNDDLNPHRGELQQWEVWNENNDLWYATTREDQAFFQDRDDKEICRHLDACGGISATSSENGMVVFRLPKMQVGLVVVCGCCGKEVAQEMFLDNENIEVKYNGAVLDRSTWDLFPNKKCARLLRRFPTEGSGAKTPTGHAYLSIRALNGLTKPVRVSHLITL